MESLTDRVAGLSADKRELLEALLRKKRAQAAAAITIRPRGAGDGPWPLSFSQERLWLIDQIEPGNAAYNMPFALRLTGTLSVVLLERVFAEIVRRHEALRTTFVESSGQPAQRIARPEAARPVLPIVDVSRLPEAVREETALRLGREEARRPFDLQQGPLLRLALLRLGAQDHLLLINLHHIISDGWSLGVLQREVCALYEAFAQGHPSPLAKLPVQYADFALWQRGRLQGEELERQLAFWRKRLAGAPPLLELPTDRPRLPVQSFRGALAAVALPPAVSGALRELGRRQDATPFMVLLAAWAVLLGRHAGQEDVVVGTPVAGRQLQELEGLIGFFVNTLALRVGWEKSFDTLLERVREDVLEAFAHQEIPFERLIGEVVTERSLAHAPLFQVLFSLQSYPAGELTLPGLRLAPSPLESGLAKFDLSLFLGETPSGFSGSLEYDADLFDASTVERLWARFVVLLEAAVETPGLPAADLPLLLPAERSQLLAWNETGEAPRTDLCLHELFAAQAARTPHATALVHGEERLTYAELAGRAGGIAEHLRGLGVGPEARVAVCLERSPDLIAALLGVLAAGGTYVPVDPNYPAERRAFMVEDSGAAVLLTEVPQLPPADLPVGQASLGHLAYLIYTSGSTGRPKGVAIEHRSAVALEMWARQEFSDEELSGVLAATSVCFDLSVFEIFVPLAFGGTIFLAENALALPELPAAGRVRLLNTVPSAAAELVRSGGIPASVETVCLAGEPLPSALAARLYATGKVRRVLNLYGPSEDTTYSTGALVPRDVLREPRPPAIGRPIRGTRAHVVDRRGALVPPEVAGELWLAGAGLARGYLGRPELTAERFTPDPWSGPGDRVYRTGDLVRRRSGGELEFLGRIDHQVKVRGFRIELGEIEAVLGSHPAVRDCAVAMQGDILVAYLAGSADLSHLIETAALHAFLRQRLPEFMAPSVFMVLDALPLTPNGKVDRRALPAPDRSGGRRESVAPRTSTEEVLTEIWKEQLGLDQVGVEDRFFELGGHSLLATRVVNRVREVFGVDVPLREIFRRPTVAGLAELIDAQTPSSMDAAVIRRRKDLDRTAPLSFSQERLWLIDQLEPGTPAYNMPLALRLTGELSPSLLERVFAAIVRRHEVLRTTFASPAGQPVQQIAAPGAARPELPLVDLSSLSVAAREEQARRLAREEAARPFDLLRGPLLRLCIMRLASCEHLLLVTMHHIISDGWSLGVLQREVGTLYAALSAGLPSPLPDLPMQYADFAAWQRRTLQEEALAALLGWWKGELAGAPGELTLPTDRSREPFPSRAGASLQRLFPRELTEALRELARREGTTTFMLLLAAYQMLLHRLSGQDDVLVGTPVANRQRLETEGLIGFFVNTLVLRGRFGGQGLTFRELLEATRETALAAFEHQDLPFERLVEALVPVRNLAVTPLFQAFFSLQTASHTRFSLPGLTLEALQMRSGMAQFELSLDLIDAGDELRAYLELTRALFDVATGQRMLEAFVHLLRAAAGAPERRIAEIPLLDEAQRHQLLREWNQDRSLPGGGASILPLFEQHAALTPGAPALSLGDRRFTYAELDRWADRVARRLRRLGVGPESRVAVAAERTPELIAAFLGILKAGGAYVPLDPAYPEERRSFMLEDAGAFLVTPELLDSKDTNDDRDGRNERRAPEAGQLAYVLYTSGSTGRPKGVMVSHGALARYAEAVRPVFAIGPGDRVLQFCSTSFDTSLEEIVTCLTGGAELVLRTDAMLASVSEFLESCRVLGVTVLSLPTAWWHEIAAKVETEGLALPPCLRLVIIGGERALLARVTAWRRAAPERPRLVNSYGVTETTIASTATDLAVPSPAEARGEVSIGRPLGGSEVLLLDREGEPVPIGTAGALLIGGGLLARGYLGRPDLTAERFMPHPFAAEPGARLYRTGDLARALPDGQLEFAGRADRQVKVRGYRIEVEEIEARLLLHPEIESAVVVAREDRRGETLLAAYFVPRSSPGPAPAALRAFVRETLPDTMTPSAYVALAALPLTPNGKVDRRALPVPESTFLAGEEILAAPSDPVEELLAGIWAEVLGRNSVGVRDDFFALGGHSLLATRVVSRIRNLFGAEIPLRQLFETPTVAELARVVRTARHEAPRELIVRVPRDGDLPLSFAQQRLWLIDQLEPGSPAYNIPSAVRLSGDISPALLERIFIEIVRRHEALRTTFTMRGGRPVQVIAPELRLSLSLVDLSLLPSDVRDDQALRLAGDEARQPFDLETGPLLRLGLLRLAPRDHVLLVTMHHIISDGWSMSVLLREIAALHAAFSEGRPSPLPELPLQYADFAVWQRAWLQGEALEAQLASWKRRLAGAPQVLDLPTDRTRPAVQSSRGATRPIELPPRLSEAVRALCRQEGTTPFMALLAAWSVLLGRHAGQDDLLVGSPIAGRNRREIEDLIGFFVNTLVLRADLSGNPSFRDVLGRVREEALEAFSHQDLPFERLVEELAPERDLSRSPLFQVLFVLQTAPAGELSVPGLSLAPLAVDGEVAKFDLTLTLGEGPAGFSGGLEHNTDLFDSATAERLLARFAALLEGAAGDPGLAVGDLPLLLPAERSQLLEWNETGKVPPSDLCLHDLFALQVAKTPHATALIHGEERMTYAELAGRAGGIAQHLRGLGVGPEVRVAVCLERSPDLIAALLGVLAAGGAYVPVDPAYPEDRRTFMVQDSGAALSLTRVKNIPPADLPAAGMKPGHLAYVIYTSGSTGRPKGVAIEHRSAVALAGWARETFSDEELSGVVAATSVCFDLSVFEIFVPLAFGGRILLADNALAVPELPAAHEARLLNTVPSAATELVRSGSLPPSVRTVCLAGEPLPAVLAARLYATGTVERVLNLYGPSEDTTYSTGALVPREPDRAPAIGRPIHGTRAHVVDRRGALVPPGVAGELWLAGDGLARGYLGRPELTAERFTPDPFGGPGERVYRTGDLVRWHSGGELEFLGRIDHQVKVRGFRIELGEIEAVLRSHPAVRDAVVLAREDRLIAYVVGAAEPVETAALRSVLRQRLPDYMVPAAFVVLDAFPLSPNGKIDRKALPDPLQRSETSPPSSAAPSDPVEELVAGIWTEVLGIGGAGIHESFFTLGGHSLLATQVVSRLRGALGVELPLRQLFETPTIAGLARAVREAGGSPAAPPLVPLPRDGEIPLSFAQQRLWLLDQIEPGSSAYNIPLALRLEGELSPGLLERAFTEIARRHETLRTTFAASAAARGEPVQVIAAEPRTVLPVVDLSRLPDGVSVARALALSEALRPFDLENGPLLRLLLVRLAPQDHLLLVTLHHIIADGWSLGVLVREVGALYAAFSQSLPSPLPELPVQYADFAVWQRSWLQGDVLAAQLDFWKRQLAGAPHVLDLPLDRPRPEVQTYNGGRRPLSLSPALSAALLDLCRQQGVTPFMALLAGWAALLGRQAGQDDVLIGSPIAGRNRQETEGLIGFFVNTLVLRSDLSGQPTFLELLGRMRRTALDAFAHQDLPFERIVEEVVTERDLAVSPLFQVLFTLQNAPLGDPAVPGLAISLVEVDAAVAKFDLALTLGEGPSGFAGSLEYNTDLFEAGTVERLLAGLTALLEEAVEDPGMPLAGLPLLRPVERRHVSERRPTREDARRLGPRDALELDIARLFEEVLNVRPVGIQDDFFALGGHSLLAARLVFSLRQRLGRSLPLAAVLRHPTVERLAALLRADGEPAPRGALVELAAGNGRPLFLVHPIGGEVLCYVPLARRLDRPVYGLQVMEGERSLEEMAELYLRSVREIQPEGPYLLGGWSLGGAVAYEMARQLERAGETVERVILIDSFPPGPWHEEVPEEVLAASFASDAEASGLLPPGLGDEELRHRFALFAANHRAMARYQGGPCAAPLFLVRAAESPVEEIDHGWGRLAGQAIEVHELPGDHYTLLQEPAVESLASFVRDLGSPEPRTSPYLLDGED